MSDYQTFSGQGSKFEKHMYYRRPKNGENPDWIVFAGTNLDRQNDMMRRGFQRMDKYGQMKDGETNPWRQILEHPDGPGEFPAAQIMELRWYKDDHCPVPGTRFPQLGGHSIREFQCPECSHLPFSAIDGLGGIEPLGRHLRIAHSWDRASLVKYGDRVGIDFDAIYSAIKTDYEFGGAKAEAKKKSSGFDCSECSWTPKANAKKPALALSLHSKQHEFTLEEVSA